MRETKAEDTIYQEQNVSGCVTGDREDLVKLNHREQEMCTPSNTKGMSREQRHHTPQCTQPIASCNSSKKDSKSWPHFSANSFLLHRWPNSGSKGEKAIRNSRYDKKN